MIGLLTCHDIYNFGSTLQAYALSKCINNITSEKCEIIDYHPNYMYKLINFFEVDAIKWRKNIFSRFLYLTFTFPYKLTLLPRYYSFKRFNKKFLSLSHKKYFSAEELSMTEYDIYCCGSDQIWGSLKTQCGEDEAFFLSFTNKRKIAYAASFGGKYVSEKCLKNVKTFLPEFNSISVREASGKKILDNNNIKSQVVIDPVFLISKKDWENLEKEQKGLPEKYIFVYGYDNSLNMQEAIDYCKNELHIPVINCNEKGKYQRIGPCKFLYLIEHASCVITSSFHATAFSIIFHKRFICVSTSNEDLFERIDNILNICGLQDRIFTPSKKNRKWLEVKIDYNIVDNELEKITRKSKIFLEKAING